MDDPNSATALTVFLGGSGGMAPDALQHLVIFQGTSLEALGLSRDKLWAGSELTSASFLASGPFTHVEEEGIPYNQGAFVARGFFEAVFSSFVEYHRSKGLTLSTHLVNVLRADCCLLTHEEKRSGPRVPFVKPVKIRMSLAPAFRSFVPLWACIAQGNTLVPVIPKSQVYYLRDVWWKEEYCFKLDTRHLAWEAALHVTDEAFVTLANVVARTVPPQYLGGLKQEESAGGVQEESAADDEDIRVPVLEQGSSKRLKRREVVQCDAATNLAVKEQCARFRGQVSTRVKPVSI
jgi:hypothetical protein